MKKITAPIIICLLCLPLICACSNKEAPANESFTAPSIISELLSNYEKSVDDNLLLPSDNAAASSLAEYSYGADDGEQTAHKTLDTLYDSASKTLEIKIGDDVFTKGKNLIINGATVRDVTDADEIRYVLDTFIKAFCTVCTSDDYTTAPDSIRASDTDVEVTRVTLKLDRQRYEQAFEKAIEAIKNSDRINKYLKDVLGLYGYLHEREESADELLYSILETVKTASQSGDQLVWQRYLYNGKVYAARLKFGENVIRYLCADSNDFTELDFEAKIGEKELSASYQSRRTGMSDTYNVRVAYGDEITYFDGSAESAYKSGKIKFDLRASKNAETVNGFQLQLDFNGVSKLKYSGNGSVVNHKNKTVYSYDLTFENVTDTPKMQTADGTEAMYEAVKKVFD